MRILTQRGLGCKWIQNQIMQILLTSISPAVGGCGLGELLSSPPSQGQVQRGGLGLDEGDLSWSCTRCTAHPLTPHKTSESKSKSTAAIAEVDLDFNAMLTRREASTPRPPSESTLLRSPPSPHSSAVGLMIRLVLQQHQSPQLQGRFVVLWRYCCFLRVNICVAQRVWKWKTVMVNSAITELMYEHHSLTNLVLLSFRIWANFHSKTGQTWGKAVWELKLSCVVWKTNSKLHVSAERWLRWTPWQSCISLSMWQILKSNWEILQPQIQIHFERRPLCGQGLRPWVSNNCDHHCHHHLHQSHQVSTHPKKSNLNKVIISWMKFSPQIYISWST